VPDLPDPAGHICFYVTLLYAHRKCLAAGPSRPLTQAAGRKDIASRCLAFVSLPLPIAGKPFQVGQMAATPRSWLLMRISFRDFAGRPWPRASSATDDRRSDTSRSYPQL